MNYKPLPRCREDVRSDEEWHFILWIYEAVKHGLVDSWQYEPESFVLFDKRTFTEAVQMKSKVKIVEKHLHAEEKYTPDFILRLSDTGKKRFFAAFKPSLLANPTADLHIDVKGAYNPFQHDQRYFSIVRKAVFARYGIWVAKVIPFHGSERSPKGLFYETFAPAALRTMKNGKSPNRIGRTCRTIEAFIAGN
jgi:hypothetical protein